MYDSLIGAGTTALPDDFLIGAATAAYQIEGGAADGGRGPSIWDTFSHTPGNTVGGATGDVATDHFHRYEEDLDLMAQVGLTAYRFSVSWSRVLPTGEGHVNRAGLDFYEQLVDGLLERGIRPMVTLNHWDLPQALEDRYGGWRGRPTAYAFERYAELLGSQLGDRVQLWATHNEPWNNSYSGYGSGVFAPGGRSHVDALRAVHHLNLAHGLGVQALRRSVTVPEPQCSVVLNVFRAEAQTQTDEDVEALRRYDAIANRAFTGPMLRGEYPADLIEDTRPWTDWHFVQPGDLQTCHQPLDLLGINYYETIHVRASRGDVPGTQSMGGTPFPGSEKIELVRPAAVPRTAMGWCIEPRGLEDHLVALSHEFPGLPLIVTENGAAFEDQVVHVDGEQVVADRERTQYLHDHVKATLRARERGANVVGYFAWSLLDNFEWAAGYGPRFGLVRVDYETLERTLKLSAAWYTALCRSRVVPELLDEADGRLALAKGSR